MSGNEAWLNSPAYWTYAHYCVTNQPLCTCGYMKQHLFGLTREFKGQSEINGPEWPHITFCATCIMQAMSPSHVYTYMCMYMNTQMLGKRERKTKQHKATQHSTRPETTFSKEKAALRWDSNPHLMHFRRDALTNWATEAAQVGWVQNHLYKPIQSKANQVSTSYR